MLSFPETMFYAEAEGLLPTRQGRINAVINDIRNSGCTSFDLYDLSEVLEMHDIEMSSLTKKEWDYIQASI